jgi:hypothetical protein
MSNHKLYCILSILTNKITHFYPKPSYFQIKQNESQRNIIKHETINRIIPAHTNKKLQIHISKTLDINHEDKIKLPKKKAFNGIEICLMTHVHPIMNHLNLGRILNNAQKYLPKTILNTIQPRITYNNLKPISHYLINQKQSQRSIQKYIQSNKCLCHLKEFEPYIRANGHIDTMDMDIIETATSDKNTARLLARLMRKGAKYIETPGIQNNKILNNITRALHTYIEQFKPAFPSPMFHK